MIASSPEGIAAFTALNHTVRLNTAEAIISFTARCEAAAKAAKKAAKTAVTVPVTVPVAAMTAMQAMAATAVGGRSDGNGGNGGSGSGGDNSGGGDDGGKRGEGDDGVRGRDERNGMNGMNESNGKTGKTNGKTTGMIWPDRSFRYAAQTACACVSSFPQLSRTALILHLQFMAKGHGLVRFIVDHLLTSTDPEVRCNSVNGFIYDIWL